VHRVHPDEAFVTDLLPDLLQNFAGWEAKHFVPEVGLFWQTGHDDGMEYNINSRQTSDIVRGGPGFRPTLNAYLWADALAIARVADLAADAETGSSFRNKADRLRANLQQKLWDSQRKFFFHLAQRDEEADGFRVAALSWTHQTGKHAGSEFGRELIGYVPWQFSLPEPGHGYEDAWRKLFTPDGFQAAFGPTTVERRDPMFQLMPTCCWWSGQSWPYATSQTLKALANLLQEYEQTVVTKSDYWQLLQTYSRTHRKDGRPYLAEACHPDTGSFEGHDSYNHSEHYFHSSFNDLVITGLVGLRPRDDDMVEIHPLAPEDWDYFALDQVPYRGRLLSIFWDRDGTRYQRGAGLRIVADGVEIAAAANLSPLRATLPPAHSAPPPFTMVNWAVNNDAREFPRATASFTAESTELAKLIDGNYWYHRDPPNRWTAVGSPTPADWVTVDLGGEHSLEAIRLYFLDDETEIDPPARYDLEYWNGEAWRAIPSQMRLPDHPMGRRANRVQFPAVRTARVRVLLYHAAGAKSGLTEFEAWGPRDQE
jgi:hypothetical protein